MKFFAKIEAFDIVATRINQRANCEERDWILFEYLKNC